MGGQEERFSDFSFYPLVLREFPKAESGKSSVSTHTSIQRYTVLALWRVINVPKNDLNVIYVCWVPFHSLPSYETFFIS